MLPDAAAFGLKETDFVASLARGLAVIRSFGAERPEQSLSEVAERTGLTRAAARRFLLTLMALGYVRQEGRRFSLTPRVLDLGFSFLSGQPLADAAQPHLQALSAALRESASIAVLDGTEIVYIARVSTGRILSVGLGVGARLPAFATSMGRVLLAALPEAEARALLAASDRRRFTARTVTDIDALMGLLAEIRAQGWASVDQELEDGLRSLAVPLVNRAGRTVAALNIGTQAARVDSETLEWAYLPRLRDTARAISQGMV